MPIWFRYSLLLIAAVWCLWYFGKMLAVGFRTGRVIDSKLPNGRPATRADNPFTFWLCMTIAISMVGAGISLVGLLGGHLLGYWDAGI
jgi:hypothetical protein